MSASVALEFVASRGDIMAMSEDQYRASHPGDPVKNDSDKGGKKPWFSPNGTGMGYHPSSWQGVLVLVVVVIVIACVIILFKRGIL
jgi:hypothetical protein